MTNTVLNTDTISGIKAQLDTQVKKVLAQKIVLAWILQGTAAEFAHMNYAEIAECIEKQPEISLIPVDPGKTNIPTERRSDKRISGQANTQNTEKKNMHSSRQTNIQPAGKRKAQIDEKTSPQIAGRINEDSVEGEVPCFLILYLKYISGMERFIRRFL